MELTLKAVSTEILLRVQSSVNRLSLAAASIDLNGVFGKCPKKSVVQFAVVSVIMPVHNGVGTINRAIASVSSQTLGEWELLVVDDGSTDETYELITNGPAGTTV